MEIEIANPNGNNVVTSNLINVDLYFFSKIQKN
jgi:hypothetical protein